MPTDKLHKGERPLILVTNDDGIDAKGLRSLIPMLAPFADIVAVAPDGPQSGQSSAITINKPLWITHHPDYCEASMYSVSGTPVDCVKLAMHTLMKRKPDMIIAGINHGANSGNSVLYSGTMGAVMEGATLRIRSIGFSLLDFSPDADFSVCHSTVTSIVSKIMDVSLPYGICLNVNIPAGREPKGIVAARAARGYWAEEYESYKSPFGRIFYMLSGHFINTEPDCEQTDEFLLKQGYAVVCPVSIEQTAAYMIDPLNDLLSTPSASR